MFLNLEYIIYKFNDQISEVTDLTRHLILTRVKRV